MRAGREDAFTLSFEIFATGPVMTSAEVSMMVEMLVKHHRFRRSQPLNLPTDDGKGVITEDEAAEFGFEHASDITSWSGLASAVILDVSTCGVNNSISPSPDGTPGVTIVGYTFWTNVYAARTTHLNDIAIVSAAVMGVKPRKREQEWGIVESLMDMHEGTGEVSKRRGATTGKRRKDENIFTK